MYGGEDDIYVPTAAYLLAIARGIVSMMQIREPHLLHLLYSCAVMAFLSGFLHVMKK